MDTEQRPSAPTEYKPSIPSSEPWMGKWNSLENALERLKQNKRVELENLLTGVFAWSSDMRIKTNYSYKEHRPTVFLSSTSPAFYLLVDLAVGEPVTVKEFLPPNPVSEEPQESPKDSPYAMLGKYRGTTVYARTSTYNIHDSGDDVYYTVRYEKEENARAPYSEFNSEFTVRFQKDKSGKFVRWNGDVRRYAFGDPLVIGERTFQLLEGATPVGKFSGGKIIPFSSPADVSGR